MLKNAKKKSKKTPALSRTQAKTIKEAFHKASTELGPIVIIIGKNTVSLTNDKIMIAAIKGTTNYVKKAPEWKANVITYFPIELVKLAALYANLPIIDEIKKTSRREGKKIIGYFYQDYWQCPELGATVLGLSIYKPVEVTNK